MLSYTIAVLSILAVFSWILFYKHRRFNGIKDKLSSIDTSLSLRLYPFTEKGYRTDEELWDALGGLKGLIHLLHMAGLMVTAATLLAREYPDAASIEKNQIWWTAVYFRINVVMTIIEHYIKMRIPSIPRVQARGCAQLYCELATTFDIVQFACKQL